MRAISKLKDGKAGGESGILPEVVETACSEEEFLSRLVELVHGIWSECGVPSEWCDAILVPFSKKGNLSNCENWRGISLLDVVEKVVSRVLQDTVPIRCKVQTHAF